MIDQPTRDTLENQIRKGDYEAAAQIYHKLVKKTITPRYLQKFLKGQKNPTGTRPHSHQPLQMFHALTQAVKERTDRQQQQTQAAQQLLQTIHSHTTQTKPIPQ